MFFISIESGTAILAIIVYIECIHYPVQGRGGWADSRHTDTAWAEVRLTDVNDNPPMFRRPHVHVTVSEDTAPGALLASIPATDPDEVTSHVFNSRR